MLMKIKKLMADFKYFIRDNTINKELRNQVQEKEISIIASDCIGGVIYKALRRRMDSPTINMFFSASDFIKFCESIDYYLEQKIVEDTEPNNEQYPVGLLGDIKLNLVHYKSIEEASEKWEKRKKRIHRESMYFIMNDRNGCTEKEIAAFDNLPYENKVIFTHIPYPKYKSAFYIPGSERDEYIKIVTSYLGVFSIKRRYDYFDVASWINYGVMKHKEKS